MNENLLEAIACYYNKAYPATEGDRYNIQELRRNLEFDKVAKLFQIIDDDHQFSAVVPWQKGADLLNSLDLSKLLHEDDLRKLQPYTLSLPEESPEKFRSIVQETSSGVIIYPIEFYDEQFGASDLLQTLVV